MTTVRVAVMGLAGMGFYHAFAAPRVEGYELTAVCDVLEDTCRNVAESSGAQPFTSFESLAASGLADAVVIATPNFLHAEHVRAALEAGLHVYCEKPLTLTAADGYALGRLARERNLKVQVGFQHRFQHNYATARRLVAEGALGPLYHVHLDATDWFRPQVYFEDREWRKRWRTAGGGVLMNQAVHQLDAFLWICGMPSRVTARVWRARHRVEVEDDILAILEFPDGARGLLAASTVRAGGANRIELHGELGSLVAEADGLRRGTTPHPVQQASDESTNPFEELPVDWEELPAPEGSVVSFDDAVLACHTDFVSAINGDRDPLNTGAEATRAVEVANAVYLSGVTEEPVSLPLDHDAYATTFERLCSGEVSLPGLHGAKR